MSLEPIEAWPAEPRSAAAYREQAQPLIAERRGVTPMERLRLFWFSTPELPYRKSLGRVAVTPNHLYVRRLDGTEGRLPRSRLKGQRRHRGRVILGVIEDDDLVLPFRRGCALQTELLAQEGTGPSGDEAVWTATLTMTKALVFSLVCAGVAVALLKENPLDNALRLAEAGYWDALPLQWHITSWVAMAAAFGCLAWLPERVRVDRLGLERRRGLVPWLTSFLPAEEIREVRTRLATKGLMAREVVVRLERRQRFLSLRRLDSVRIARYSHSFVGRRQAELRADAAAKRVQRILGLEES